MNKPKNATTAGLLGVFLGVFGVHDWYLGKKKPALLHSLLAIISITFMAVVIYNSSSYDSLGQLLRSGSGFMFIFYSLGWLAWIFNVLWSAVEGFLILARATFPQSISAPLDPVFKKRFTLICGSAAGVISLASILLIVLSVILRVDYGETYRLARNLRAGVSDLYNGGVCDKVIDYADSAWVSASVYNSYVDDCKKLLGNNIDLIDQLRIASGIKKDSQILEQFELFSQAYTSAIPPVDTLDSKLDLYKAWHDYAYVADDLTTSSDESEYQAAADILINTGNADLIDYAKGWLELAIAYRAAYRNYWDNPRAGNGEYEAVTAARLALRTYDNEHTPDLAEVVGLNFPSTSKMYQEFRTLYSLITDAYEKHYDYDSGDCTTVNGKAYCS